jgi:hypothetical protein
MYSYKIVTIGIAVKICIEWYSFESTVWHVSEFYVVFAPTTLVLVGLTCSSRHAHVGQAETK